MQIVDLKYPLMFVAAVLVLWADRRRRKKAERLNERGLCARCGGPLKDSEELIPISGQVWRGYACHQCASVVKVSDRVVLSLLFLAFVLTLLFSWWANHA